ncbi:MAG: bifunctional riboflavin kinase/FAD synthetase [Firmicutes bacterium]|nr:bifunctional riboflavin kinase/FAD synthetase [Bacillota bacterium]MBQ7059876.1 bifunctional riboflavin kinase/FAD synthetase [Bacillota bacterium]
MVRIEDDLLMPFEGSDRKAAVCLGNFDGVHIGHQALLLENSRKAAEQSLVRRVVTFDPHPGILMGDPRLKLIHTKEQKADRIEETGHADELIFLHFTEALRSMEPERFFEEILLSRYQACLVTVGDDFRFGKYGRGDVKMLEKLCGEAGISLIVLPRVEYGGAPVSSSRVRAYLESGQIEKASELMGRRCSLSGIVEEGKHVGRKLHAPTVNIMFEEHQVIPMRGVYVSEIEVRGQKYFGVSNVGINPTFGGEAPRIETYIFDFEKELYREKIRVSLLRFLRPEKAFDSPEDLKAQIARDVENAKAYVKEMVNP